MMDTVYLDESHGEEDVYTVAGYVASVEQWTKFGREWRQMLKDEDITELHKAAFENLWGEYKKWRNLPKPEQDDIKLRINKRAVDIILRNVRAGFCSSIQKSEWDSMDKGRWSRHIGESFYAAGVHDCMQNVATWVKRFNIEGTIDYVFESGAEGASEIVKVLQLYDRDETAIRLFRLRNWGFANKRPNDKDLNKATVQLQAADFLAYESYRHMGNCVIDGGKIRKDGQKFAMRGALHRLLQHDQEPYADLHVTQKPVPHYMLHMDKEFIRNLVKASDERFPTHNVLVTHYRALTPKEVKDRYNAHGTTLYDFVFFESPESRHLDEA